MSLKQTITDDMKAAMKAKDKERLGTIRLMLAAIKQREVDERIELDDEQVLITLDKMVKQRRDSIKQYQDANRQELADKEQQEIDVIQEFLPQQLTADEVAQLIDQAIAETAASSMADMGKIMAILKPQMQGRTDIAEVSKLVKSKLS